MKLTELRIGNLFYPMERAFEIHMPVEALPYKVCTIGFKIEAIQYQKIPAQVEQWTKFEPRDLSPILITEYWKILFGFVDGKLGCLHLIRINEFYHVAYIANGESIPVDVKYVHQLQNLYYAIHGEELSYSTH